MPVTPIVPVVNQDPATMPITAKDICKIFAVVSLAAAAQHASPVGENQTQQTGNIITNPALLPAEVRHGLEKGEQHDIYLTKGRDVFQF